MVFSENPTELTTAATDLVLALVAFACLAGLLGRTQHSWRRTVWAIVFAALGTAALLGTVAHGLELAPETGKILWQPLYLALGLTVTLFCAGALCDVSGEKASRRCLPGLLALSLFFYGLTLLLPDSFIYFTVFQGLAMLFCLGAYAYVRFRRDLAGSLLILTAILMSMAAALAQSQGTMRLSLIWQFNNNGIYHLIQTPAVLLLFFGIKKGL